MANTIKDTTHDTFVQAAAAHAVPRSMSRSDMPFRDASADMVSGDGYEVADDNFRLIVKRALSGDGGLHDIKAKVDVEVTPAGDDDPEGEDDDDDDEQNAGDAVVDKRDVIAWIPCGGGDAFTDVCILSDGVRVLVTVCSDEATEMSILDLAATLTRTVVKPFGDLESRREWKDARRPYARIKARWSPQEGSFDLPIARRLETIVDSTNKRIDKMYDTVFTRKLTTLARSATTRWAKKAGVPVPRAPKKRDNGAQASGDSPQGSS